MATHWLEGSRPILPGAKRLAWDRYHNYSKPDRVRSNHDSRGRSPDSDPRPGGEAPNTSPPVEPQRPDPPRNEDPPSGLWGGSRTFKGTAAILSDSLERGAGAFGQYDSGSTASVADRPLSERNPSKRTGITIGRDTPPSEIQGDGTLWSSGSNEGWIDSAQGFRENRQEPLAADKILQSFLADNKFDPGEIDGYFGPKSKKALEDFQSACGIAVTGTMNDETKEAIKKVQAEESRLW